MALPMFDPAPDIRLIAADMDGTLLDDAKELHDHFWPLVDQLFERGILFCPASGRQYHSLYRSFGDVADELAYIAENGAYVLRGREELSSHVLDDDVVARLVASLRASVDAGADIGVIVSGKAAAYVERRDAAFRDSVFHHFPEMRRLNDVLDRPVDPIVKVAIYCLGGVELEIAETLETFTNEVRVVIPGERWVDVIHLAANKGVGLRHLQEFLGITPAQTMVFGDFLNDLEMMDAADYSFAMDNAHPLLRERARFVAPPNYENGVIRVISSVLGLPWTEWDPA